MKIDLSHAAESFLTALPAKQYKQVAARVLSLSRDQGPKDSRHLSGHPGYKRLDQGEYRIIFHIENNVAYITNIGKRNDNEVYKQFSRQ